MTTKEQITTMLDTMTELELLKLHKHMIEMQIANKEQVEKIETSLKMLEHAGSYKW